MDENKGNLDDSLVTKIKKGELAMRPKYVFYATFALLVIGIISLFIVSAWLANILIYKLRVHNLWDYMSYGESGVNAFWLNIPVGALILSLISFVTGILLLRKFDICYKKNFPFIILGLLTVVVVLSFLIDRKGINKTLDQEKYLFNVYHNKYINPDWLIGTVIYRDPKGYYVRNLDGKFFRAIPIDSKSNQPVINRTECIKIKGIITDDYTIRTYNLYKCPYKPTRL
jgi:hypothetical protein